MKVGQLQKAIEAAVDNQEGRRRPNLRDKDQLAQAVAIYHRHIFGDRTVPELVEEFGIPETTIKRRLSLAREVGIPDQVREVFIHEMLPMAMGVIRQSLLSDDQNIALRAASMVIKELDALKPKQVVVNAEATTTAPSETLEEWRSRLPATPTIISIEEVPNEPEKSELCGGGSEVHLAGPEISGERPGQGESDLQELPND